MLRLNDAIVWLGLEMLRLFGRRLQMLAQQSCAALICCDRLAGAV